ncbi:esterase [Listeria fleischmannii 1991]|uniref:Esterase n=2 Tax=Listeria fleischmannii TaxID=1069827 RepID=A0A0J8GC25_9LIST|nr:alpha/beta hydrolase [Listeria fleischmannii]EMG28391.1 esterase [Listeria fleischmannii subsp. fleischmannii LU2006-1]KMT58484.1 esterase [Listeria fleischmannii 1991]SQC69879.1 putative hydrolase [Listeria fleischmannii subsp. fleischmannii]
MDHIFIPGDKLKKPLLLLHGTGGDENSLVDIGKLIANDAPILSLCGDVSENGANRFFKRFSDGRLDLLDLAIRTKKLLQTTYELAETYEIDFQDLVVVGYSNGANIAANAILQEEDGFQNAILLHAMPANNKPQDFSLEKRHVFLTAGVNDPLVPFSSTKALVDLFQDRAAEVQTVFTEAGHNLTREEIEDAKLWYENLGVEA